MKQAMRRLSFLAVLPLLTACAATPSRDGANRTGDVSLASIEPPDAERHEVGGDEDFQMGVPIIDDSRVMPVYPDAWLGRAPQWLEICVELTVDERGGIEATRPLREMPGCGVAQGEMADAFDAAVVQAVQTWRFHPSIVCRLESGEVPRGECRDAQVNGEAVAVLRAYRFVFEQRADGGARVRVSEN